MEMIVVDRRFLTIALAGLPLTACSPLGLFNSLSGQEPGGKLLVEGLPFGTHPRQRLDIYGPEPAPAKAPVVMFIYGGSWNSGQRADYAFVGRALAAHGFVTVIADYRLVPEVVFPVFLEDGAAAVRFVRDTISRYGGDPSRLALAGHSAGAYNAVMLSLDQRYLRAAGVSPSTIRCVAGLAGPYDFLPFTSPDARAALGTWPRPEETQPITHVRAGAPPTFLATGDADTTVKPANTSTLARLLRTRGAVVEERHYAGVDHAGILLALSQLRRANVPVLADITAFLRRHLIP